ncbi:rod shape-determining protein [Flavobacterium sp. 3-210]
MRLLEFITREIAVDLGTANTLIIYDNKIVIDSPSIVARDINTNTIIAVGREASLMQGKTHKNIRTIRPIKEGVISDFDASEKMISGFLAAIPGLKLNCFPFSLRMMVCIPLAISDIEIRAIRESCEKVRVKEILFIYEPLAAAIGIGLDIRRPLGTILVNIGSGATEIAVMALGGIICSRSIKIGGDVFTEDIVHYMKVNHQLQIGLSSAEKVKIEAGSTDEMNNATAELTIKGINLITGKIHAAKVGHKEIMKALDESINSIEEAILSTLSMAPPEIAADIYWSGLYLAGGGAFLQGLDQRITDKTGLKVHIGEDPIRAAVKGANLVLKNKIDYQDLLFREVSES